MIVSARQAHRLLDAARDGADVSEATILRCLRETGDLGGLSHYALELALEPTPPKTARDLHARLLDDARALLRQHGAEHVGDDFALQWAEIILRQNPRVADQVLSGVAS